MKKRKMTSKITFFLAIGLAITFFGSVVLDGLATSDTVEYGDIVNVQYWLYLNPDYSGDPRDNGILNYVYVSQGTTVPNDVQQKYPDAKATYLEDFKTNLVGMKEGETKRFVIPADRGYNDPRYGDLYGKDLYFQVKLLKIVYKGSSGGGNVGGTQGFFESNSTLILLGVVLSAVIIGVGIYNYKTAARRRKYEHASSSDISTEVIHGSYDKRLHSLKELSSSLEKTSATKKSTTRTTTSKIKPRSKTLKPRKR